MRFVIRTEVEETREAWEAWRRYSDFTQLRKRLLRLGADVPALALAAMDAKGTGPESRGGGGLTLAPDLPRKTWRSNKFDTAHLASRRAALEAYLRGVVEVSEAAGGRWRPAPSLPVREFTVASSCGVRVYLYFSFAIVIEQSHGTCAAAGAQLQGNRFRYMVTDIFVFSRELCLL